MKLSDRDWDLLSAYADNELDPGTRAALERRLRREPLLAAELARIRRSKKVLGRLQPSPDRGGRSRRGWKVGPNAYYVFSGLLGALFAASVFFLIGTEGGNRPSTEPRSDWHDTFGTGSYGFWRDGQFHLSAGRGAPMDVAPDLQSFGLTLVDIRTRPTPDGETIGLHYRGSGNCRVTFAATPVGGMLPQSDRAEASRFWKTGAGGFALFGDGLDRRGFESLSLALEAQTRGRSALIDPNDTESVCANDRGRS
ncbi:MAG: hypothetical protein AAGF59_13495 [Pseudomonadota bacterium]